MWRLWNSWFFEWHCYFADKVMWWCLLHIISITIFHTTSPYQQNSNATHASWAPQPPHYIWYVVVLELMILWVTLLFCWWGDVVMFESYVLKYQQIHLYFISLQKTCSRSPHRLISKIAMSLNKNCEFHTTTYIKYQIYVVVVELTILEWHCYFADRVMWVLMFGYLSSA